MSAALVAACGGSGGPSAHRAAADTGSPTSTSSTAAPTSITTAQSGRTTTTAKKGTGGGPGSTSSTTATTRPGGGASGPAPAASGTYRYRQTGSAHVGGASQAPPAEGTLVVDRAGAGPTQTWHRYVDPKQAPNDLTFRFASDGVYLTGEVLRISQPGGSAMKFTCNFGTGVAAPPWPPTVGRTYSGHGDCNGFTADATGKVESTRTVTVDGASTTVYVLKTDVVTHGSVESTGTQVDWYAPSLGLPVHEENSTSGTYGVVDFDNAVTADLESGRPS